MATIQLDPAVAHQLAEAGGQATVADADGKVFGVLLSQEEHALREKHLKSVMYDLAFATMDVEANRAALANPVRYSVDEVIKMIEES